MVPSRAFLNLPLRVLSAVESADFGPVLLELAPQQVMVGRFAGEAVPVLGQHHRDAACCNQVPNPVHARSLKAGAALAGVYYLLEDLVPLSGSIFPQGFKLLRE